MALIETIQIGDAGCPSGLKETPIRETNPLGDQVDFSSFVETHTDGSRSLDLITQGAHCGGCLAKIERGISALLGVTNARMNLSTMKLHVRWTGDDTTPKTIIQTLGGLGYGAAPYEITAMQDQSQKDLKSLLRAMAVAGFATMNVMLLSIAVWSGADMNEATRTALHWISAMIAIPAIAYAGRPFFTSAWSALKNKRTNMDVPISLAVILACSLSIYETVKGNPDTYFDAAVMLLFLLLIGRYLDARLRAKTGAAAHRLAAMQVTSATRILKSGKLETVPASLVQPNDKLLIPTGQRIPVDARIIDGRSEIDMQIATGETVPKLAALGDTVYSGTVNLTAPLTVSAIARASDSFLTNITKLVETGAQSKSKFVKIADRAARAYVPVVHTLALLTFAGWMLVGADLRPAVLNAIAVLIITCPCALGLAVPAVQIVATGQLFKAGVLIKSGDALERLAQTKSVIFDKTGTLTNGKFELINANNIPDKDLKIAAALALYSRHPLSKALHAYRGDLKITDIQEIPGLGLTALFDGQTVKFGSRKLIGMESSFAGSSSESWLVVGGAKPVCFMFEDKPSSDASATLRELETLGLTTELLSGDSKTVTQSIAEQLNIKEYHGEVSPEDKQKLLYERQAQSRYPLMVGDGINDAPALAAANSSATIATASDVSRAAADIILQGDKLSGLPIAIKTARAAQRRVRENLTLAIIYNFIAIPLAVFGYVTPLVAAVAMSGSSLLVTLNALRMKAS